MNDFEFAFEVAKIADEVSRMKRNVSKAFDEINQEMPLPKSDDFVLDETDIDAVANDAFSNGYAKGLATALKIFCKAFEDEPQTDDKHAVCTGCDYYDLPNTFHPCASCVDFSKYKPKIKDEPQTDEPTWEQVKEYCNKRCLDIVDSALRKKWYKDEPQTVLEAVLDRQTDEDRRKMAESVRKAIKDEPQTVRSNLEPFRVDEPQTDCAWK